MTGNSDRLVENAAGDTAGGTASLGKATSCPLGPSGLAASVKTQVLATCIFPSWPVFLAGFDCRQ